MKFTLCFAVYAFAACAARAGPAPPPPPFADAKAERESAVFNEVGPQEDWTLMRRLSKTNAEDTEKSLAKEIEEFTRFVKSVDRGAEDATTTEDGGPQDDEATEEPDAASSDWTGVTWRKDGDAPSDRQEAAAGGDDGNFEDIVKKISNDLKKLYGKIKQVMNVVKNWINAARGQRSGFDDEPYPMTASASESDGVFVIAAEPLIADVDKSNKYTVPIHAD